MSAFTFKEALRVFARAGRLQGTFGEPFYTNFNVVDQHPLLTRSGHRLLTLPVLPSFCNVNGVMHGGALASVLDCATTIAILEVDKKRRKTVSLEFNLSFPAAAKQGSNILILTEVLRVGRTSAFSQAEIFDEDGKTLCATGRHLKAFLQDPFELKEASNTLNK
eukprot:TRINITY_DN834_c0_g1_i2.p1 TRINITY_DN834_c0_g1~~TRINITY_DN834_c0_g1_i2.p1  ORF type:complete len:164 (-),score=32.61 TRINITY_DN834_c0_g1_i2:167-658(-)